MAKQQTDTLPFFPAPMVINDSHVADVEVGDAFLLSTSYLRHLLSTRSLLLDSCRSCRHQSTILLKCGIACTTTPCNDSYFLCYIQHAT